MLHVLRLLIAVVTLGWSLPSVAQPEQREPQRTAPAGGKRIALLIGNARYVDPKLSGIGIANVGRDLELLSSSFRKAGFETTVATDLDASAIQAHLARFGSRARDADAAVVYFTGFGVQVAGIDYLAGVDAGLPNQAPKSLEDLGYVSVANAALAVQQARTFALVLSEANRDDPWRASGTRGVLPFSTVEDSARDAGVVIFYGSQDGTGSDDGPAGGNAPFAAAFAWRMLEPGIEFGLMARRVTADVVRATRGKQRPKLYGELREQEFYFVSAAVARSLPPPQPQQQPTFVTSTQPRLALVIGNGDYNQNGWLTDDRASPAVREQGFAPDLPNAPTDASDVAKALVRMGFATTLAVDADYRQMLTTMFEFERTILEAKEDAIVVVYYAGHALQVGGGNYLVPVGAKFPDVDFDRLTGQQAELMLSQYALPLQTSLLGRLKNPSRRGLNLVVLDACRENPFEKRSIGRDVTGRSRSRGLGEVRIDLRRTAIAFATKPGDVADDGGGRNSPYTTALKSLIEQPGLSVIELLNQVHERVEADTNGKQVPWMNSPALGKTCLAACADIQ